MQRFTLTLIARLAGLGREHQAKRVNDIGASLLACSALAEYAGNLRDRRDEPAFLAWLVDDRQVKLLSHKEKIPSLGIVHQADQRSLERSRALSSSELRGEVDSSNGCSGKSLSTIMASL